MIMVSFCSILDFYIDHNYMLFKLFILEDIFNNIDEQKSEVLKSLEREIAPENIKSEVLDICDQYDILIDNLKSDVVLKIKSNYEE